MRKKFEMTDAQYEKILDASRPVPYIAAHCGPMASPQETANRAWEELGKELGFKFMTVEGIAGESKAFTAEVLKDV